MRHREYNKPTTILVNGVFHMETKLHPRRCALAFLGSAILAFGLYNIHSFADITEGGVLGLALFFEHHFSISPSLSSLVLNAVFYFLGWRSLGREFVGYSIFAGGGFSLCYAIFEKFPPLFPSVSGHPLLAALCGALFVGVGCGLAVRAGGAPSGDDAFAMSFSKLFKTNIWVAYFISDVSVLLLSLSYIPAGKIFYSLITVLLSGQLVDFIGRIGKRSEPAEEDRDVRDVLVGTLRNRDQLTVALANRFYHIPAARVCKEAMPPRYIAIYQSHHKFADNPGVLYYGEVEKYSLVRRSEINEIPRASSERYYRFDIKEWKSLPEKIFADRGDFIALSTNFYLLTHARSTSELFLRSRSELLLFRDLQKLISGEVRNIPSKSGDSRIFIEGDKLVLMRNSRPFFSCTVEDYRQNPLETFSQLAKFLIT